jgi:polyhydroxyalkanoate synthesis regulator phasin
LGVGAGVKLLQSGLIEVPMVVGWLSPVILVPAAAFTALTPEQLRMVLAHELTHIRRHDHLVNMVQGVVEVILFFHPVTWWLSRQIRIEREHCCDSASIVSVGTPKSLVEALLKLESLRAPNPSTTIAATGGTFMQRIQRILTTSNNHPPTRSGWKALTACTAAALIGVAGLTTLTITGPALAQEMQRPAAAEEDASFTMSDVIIKVTMALESGDITPAQAAEYIIAAENALQAEIAFKAYEDQVMAAVRAGDLTREQAGADIKAYKADAWREASEALGMRLKTAVESGKMTREEAGEVYGVMMDKAGSGKTKQMTRKDYAEAEAKMKKMVAAGEITQEQMTIRLNEMREAIARQAPKLTRKDYAEAEAKMKKMVEAGEITQEQMEARLNRMQQMMAQQSPKMTRKDYVEAEAKMKKMVAAGEITQEQMTGRLNRMQKMMAQQAPGHGAARINQVDWDAVKARVEGAVASGAMTREQADEVYAGLKKRMAAVKGKASAESRTAISDECRELRIRLGEAVRSGEMTREQASEQWLAECGDER